MTKKLVIGIASILLCGVGYAVYTLTQDADEPGVLELIAEADVHTDRPVPDLEFAKRHKVVRLEQATLTSIVQNADSLTLRLFQGETLEILIDERQKIDETFAIAYGKVKGAPDSTVMLSVAGDAMTGSISIGDGRTFRIDPIGGGVHKLVEVDDTTGDVCEHPEGPAGEFIAPNGEKIQVMYQRISMFRNGGNTRPLQSLRRGLPSQRIASSGSSDSARSARANLRLPGRAIINVPRNFYTGPRFIQPGGPIYSRFAFRNGMSTTYKGWVRPASKRGPGRGGSGLTGGGGGSGGNSGGSTTGGGSSSTTLDILVLYTDAAAQEKGGVNGIKSLAGAAVGNVNTALKNSGVSERAKLVATEKINHTSSGNMGSDLSKIAKDSQVASWRTKYKADLVSMLVKNSSGSTTGMGHVGPANGNKGAAYSVCKVMAVGAPNRSFAHEIGHNLGCAHAKDQGSGAGKGAFGYSHGWRFEGTDKKKYRTLLSYQKNAGEARIPYYSNPSIQYKGMATGTSAADNGKTVKAVIKKAIKYY